LSGLHEDKFCTPNELGAKFGTLGGGPAEMAEVFDVVGDGQDEQGQGADSVRAKRNTPVEAPFEEITLAFARTPFAIRPLLGPKGASGKKASSGRRD
jgi:hypothetical protein